MKKIPTKGIQAIICTCNSTVDLAKEDALFKKLLQTNGRDIPFQVVADFCKRTADYRGNFVAFACSEHELGHYFLKRDDAVISCVDIKRLNKMSYNKIDQQAVLDSLLSGALIDLDTRGNPPKRKIDIKKKVLILGSGLSAMITAERITRDPDIHVTVISKGNITASKLSKVVVTRDNLEKKLVALMDQLKERKNVKFLEDITNIQKTGHLGNFEVVTSLKSGEELSIEAGVIALSGDFKEFDVSSLGNVPAIDGKKMFTWSNFDSSKLPEGAKVLIISCMGSRSVQRPYCSSYCCETMVKRAGELADSFNVTVLHKGIRTLGTSELDYLQARKKGVKFIAGSFTQAELDDDKLVVITENTLLQEKITFIPDAIIFSSALLPPEEADFLENLGLKRLENGFLDPLYTKLRTERTSIPGILVSNTLLGPSLIDELQDSAKALALEVLKLLGEGVSKMQFAATVNEETCTGCEACIKNCPATAITLEDGKASVNQNTCILCETCTTVCPTGAVTIENEKENLLDARITAMTKVYKESTSTPLVYLMACSECGQAAVNMLTELDENVPVTVPVTVSCGSSVSLTSMLKCFEQGADGLVLAVCQHCHKGKGHEIASGVSNIAGQILEHAGLGKWRITVRKTYAHQPDSILEALNGLVSKITAKGGQ
ncbi:MAG: hydrogenase iron-sulfur subunit [Candidatus Odinarchaeota archaeon]